MSSNDEHVRHVLVIGMGNDLRGDDAVGRVVAESVAEADSLRVIVATQILPEHVAAIAEADVVIFIDASARIPPGEISVESIFAQEQTAGSHWLSPQHAIEMSKRIFGQSPRAFLIEIGADSFELDAPLTPRVSRAVRRLQAELPRWIATLKKAEAVHA